MSFWAISMSLSVLMLRSTSVSSVIMALVSILPSSWIFVPLMMFMPDTAYHVPLYSSVLDIDKPKSRRFCIGTKTAKKFFSHCSNSWITLSRKLPVIAGTSDGMVKIGPVRLVLRTACLRSSW